MVRITCRCGGSLELDAVLSTGNSITISSIVEKFMKTHSCCIEDSGRKEFDFNSNRNIIYTKLPF